MQRRDVMEGEGEEGREGRERCMGEAGGRMHGREGGEALDNGGGGRAGGRGEMEGGGPVKLTHLGSSSPVSVHGCWPSFVGDRLCSRAFVFVSACSSSWAGGGVVDAVWW